LNNNNKGRGNSPFNFNNMEELVDNYWNEHSGYEHLVGSYIQYDDVVRLSKMVHNEAIYNVLDVLSNLDMRSPGLDIILNRLLQEHGEDNI
jgi:hypothetical protein